MKFRILCEGKEKIVASIDINYHGFDSRTLGR